MKVNVMKVNVMKVKVMKVKVMKVKVMKKMRSLGPIIFTALIILTACEPGQTGIFFSLSNVIQIDEESRGLGPKAGIRSFTELGNHYYLTTSTLKVRRRGASSSSNTGYAWTEVKVPSADYPLALKVSTSGTNLIVNFSNSEMPRTALFQSTEIDYPSAGNASWTNITPNALGDGERIPTFFTVNGQIIAVIQNLQSAPTFTYRLYNVNANDRSSGNFIGDAQPLPFLDAEFDGTNYWFISTDKIFSTSDLTSNTLTQVDTTTGAFVGSDNKQLKPADNTADERTFGFSGLGLTGERIYLVTRKSHIFVHENSAWSVFNRNDSSAGAVRFADSNEVKTIFTDVLIVDDSFSGTEQTFVSSQNEGYAFINFTDRNVTYLNSATDTGTTNFFSTALHNGFISTLYYSASEKNLFALTPQDSLWRGSYSNGYLTWNKEQ